MYHPIGEETNFSSFPGSSENTNFFRKSWFQNSDTKWEECLLMDDDNQFVILAQPLPQIYLKFQTQECCPIFTEESSEFEKQLVPDLKKELKNRGLSTTGNKAELIQRLTEHISSEEKEILQGDDVVTDDSSIDVPEEAVLGLLASPHVTNSPGTVLGNGLESHDKPKIEAEHPHVVVKTHSSERQPVTPPTVSVPVGKISLKLPSPAAKIEAPTVPVGGPSNLKILTAEERKLERAKKFDIPPSAEDRKELRAQRFGTASTVSKTGSGTVENNKALEKRAERFGLPTKGTSVSSVSSEEMTEKLKQRAERFGKSNVTNLSSISTGKIAISVDDSKQKLLKRKERFGPATTKDEIEEKKLKRSERFKLE